MARKGAKGGMIIDQASLLLAAVAKVNVMMLAGTWGGKGGERRRPGFVIVSCHCQHGIRDAETM